MLEKFNWMHHHDQCEISDSETYRFFPNFEMENTRLEHSGDQNVPGKLAEK